MLAERRIGYTLAQVVGKTRTELGYPESVRVPVDTACRTAIASGERQEVELVTPFGADEEEKNAALDQCDFDGSMKRLAEGLEDDDDLEGACHE